MRVIPVIDLKDGVVVRGVAGQRAEYAPVTSQLAADARPATVARAFVEQLKLRTIYVADLDAIAGAAPDFASYREIADTGASLWLDAGVGSAERLQVLAEWLESPTLERVIVGLESLGDPAELPRLGEALGERGTFSLDLKSGQPLTQISVWQSAEPLELAGRAVDAGFESLIVLDLAQVGVEQGPSTTDLCRQLRSCYPHVALTGGGGVRQLDDLRQLQASGCEAALVATALHRLQLTAEQIREIGGTNDAPN